MPPKKPVKQSRSGSGGESKTGLVVTLVFFILATIGLGVAAYYGFTEQQTLTAEKKKALDDTEVFKAERDWYRFQSHLYRMYMGSTPKDIKMDEFAQKKQGFDKFLKDGVASSLPFKGPDIEKTKDDVRTFVGNLSATMPWEGAKDQQPKTTYETRLKALEDAYRALEKVNAQVRAEKDAADKRVKEVEGMQKVEQDTFKTALVKLEADAKKDRDDDRNMIKRLSVDLEEKSKEKGKAEEDRAKATKSFEVARKGKDTAEAELKGIKTENKELKDDLTETKSRLADVRSRAGIDSRREDFDRQDAEVRKKLDTWSRDWKIVMLDKRGEMPYINLGSADKVTPQLSFSVHSTGSDGKMSPTRKATVEVVQVIGPNMSRARVTWLRDRDNDPIVKGDKLFNSSWDPTRKTHVALVGIMDLGDDGRDSTEELRRMLERQGVVIDTYLDTKDLTMKGPGLNSNTTYLIEGKRLENTTDPRGRDKVAADRVDKAIRDAKAQARVEGVTLIGLSKYLDQIGYRGAR